MRTFEQFSDDEKAKVNAAKIAAWNSLQTKASLAQSEFNQLSKEEKFRLINIDILLSAILKGKINVDKVIDEIPE